MGEYALIPVVAIMIPIVAIIGAFTVVAIKIQARARVRELEVRERIAMIERGLVPAPETDPKGFEQALALQRLQQRGNPAKSAVRHRRLGVTLMGVGFGLMLLLGVAADNPEGGIGIGGFIVILGIAFFVNSWFDLRHAAADPTASGDALPPR